MAVRFHPAVALFRTAWFLSTLAHIGCIAEQSADRPPEIKGTQAAGDSAAQPADTDPPQAVVLHPFFDNGRWGYLDNTRRVGIVPQYASAKDFFEDRAAVMAADPSKSGYIRPDGSWAVVLPDGAEPKGRFVQGRAKIFAVSSPHFGFVDSDGKIVLPPKFDWVEDFSEGLAVVNTGRQNPWTPPQHRKPKGEERYGFIDRSGQVVLPLTYSRTGPFGGGLAPIRRGSVFEYIDRNGVVVFSLADLGHDPQDRVSSASRFSNGLAVVSFHSTRLATSFAVFINPSGRQVGPQFEEAGAFSEALARVKVQGKVGYVDTTARLVIPARFDQGNDFHDGRCLVLEGDAWRYIDVRGFVVAKGGTHATDAWNDAEDFHGGLARVHIGGAYVHPDDGPGWWSRGKWVYVDRRGTIVCVCRHDTEQPIEPPLGKEFGF